MQNWPQAGGIAAATLLSIPAGWAATRLARWQTESSAPPLIPMVSGTIITALWAASILPWGYLLVATLLLGWILCVLSAVDALVFRLPDVFTFPLILGGLALSFWLPDHDPVSHFAGAAVGFAVLYAVAMTYRHLRGREGLGLGDAKLAAAVGAWLGWQALPSVMLIGCAAAFIWIGVRVLFQGRSAAREQIAFGVPLCLAFWLVWLYGPPL